MIKPNKILFKTDNVYIFFVPYKQKQSLLSRVARENFQNVMVVLGR